MKLTLKTKAILMIVIISLLIGVAGIIIFNKSITDLTMEEYETRSIDVAETIAQIVDPNDVREIRDTVMHIYNASDEVVLSDQWGTPEWEAYVAQFTEIEDSKEFASLRKEMRKVQDVIDVDCVYIIWIDTVQNRYIYLVDAAYEDACPPGVTDPLYFDDPEILANIENICPPNITHTEEYGYLLSTGMPIRTENGELVGYATVDISMNEIMAEKNNLLLLSLAIFGGITLIAIVIGIYAVDRTIVTPINKLSKTANEYNVNELNFQDVDIHTGDEIENLSNSMKQMERDIKDYYDNLMTTRSDLASAKESAETYRLEAIIDPLTGIRNKRAYDLKIAEIENDRREYAIAMVDLNDLKLINDKYGHEKGDVAIQTLSKLICDIFKHSSVFRIGGDEFVVIMLNDDFESMKSVIGHFRDEVRRIQKDKSLKPWEKVSAAIGCAVYDENNDDNAASVFKRADQDMYEHKIKMKKKA